MKKLLSAVTALAILMPVSAVFAAQPQNSAAPHEAVSSMQDNKASAATSDVTPVKHKKAKKGTKVKRHKASAASQTQAAPKQ